MTVRLTMVVAALAASTSAHADLLQDWTELAIQSSVAAKHAPFVQTRTTAMLHLAMFEAINGSDGPYHSYLKRPEAPRATAASMTGGPDENLRAATAAVAAHGVLLALFPEQKPSLDATLTKALATSDATAREAAMREGRLIAAAVIDLRANDGAGAPNTWRPVTKPGAYIPAALPVGTAWVSMKPWTMKSCSQFRPPPPPKLTSHQWAEDYDEIKSLGGKSSAVRTPRQTETARFWVVTGPASWSQILASLAGRGGRTLVQNARLYALVSLAVADSYIAVFDAKYQYSFWRPATAIRNGDVDGNPATERDAAWEPLIETPMHPEYPCAHCINSGAIATVLESEFGTGHLEQFQMTSPTLPGVTHAWDTIAQYAQEVSNSRVWGGIHYRNSAAVGADMGRRLGQATVASILRPR